MRAWNRTLGLSEKGGLRSLAPRPEPDVPQYPGSGKTFIDYALEAPCRHHSLARVFIAQLWSGWMADVFISYARSTAKQAQAAAGGLRSFGYSVWLDEDLPTHRSYTDVIEEELASAKAVLVVWSAEAVKSQWVKSEANRAREDDKLIQMAIDGARLPMPFDQIQCADLKGWIGDPDTTATRSSMNSSSSFAARCSTKS